MHKYKVIPNELTIESFNCKLTLEAVLIQFGLLLFWKR